MPHPILSTQVVKRRARIASTLVGMDGTRDAVASDPLSQFGVNGVGRRGCNRCHFRIFAESILEDQNIAVSVWGQWQWPFNICLHDIERMRRARVLAKRSFSCSSRTIAFSATAARLVICSNILANCTNQKLASSVSRVLLAP